MYSPKMQMHWHLTSNQLILIMKVFTKHKILPDRKSSKHVHTHPCLYTYPVYIMRDDWWLYTWVHIPCGQSVNEGWLVTVHRSTPYPMARQSMRDDRWLYTRMEALVTNDCTQEWKHWWPMTRNWPPPAKVGPGQGGAEGGEGAAHPHHGREHHQVPNAKP